MLKTITQPILPTMLFYTPKQTLTDFLKPAFHHQSTPRIAMEFLQSLLEASSFPIFTAFILGLMTAVSPCPLATNITATAFIAREINNKKYVFLSGVYTLGRAISYTLIGVILFFGASTFQIALYFPEIR
jgi:thiol:disulfide interchange protein